MRYAYGMDIADPRLARYAVDHSSPLSPDLQAVAEVTHAGVAAAQMMSGRVEVRLLQALAFAGGATRVLEVGTMTGFGALALAEALPSDGRVVTIEADEAMVKRARLHLGAHPDGAKVELIAGDARQVLRGLEGPFDLAYVDAWKPDYPEYFELVLPLLGPRGVIVFDNALQGGQVLDDGNAIAAFNAQVQADPRVRNALLTVGDGVLLVWPA